MELEAFEGDAVAIVMADGAVSGPAAYVSVDISSFPGVRSQGSGVSSTP